MPSGGARTRSGPPPDPNALRRDRDAGEWIELPASGRPGPSPAWPFGIGASPSEQAVWDDLWSMPQAIIWERHRQGREVALYVRRYLEAMERDSSTGLSTVVRQLADSLGLTSPGMRSMRWKIVPDSAPVERTASATDRRDRFRVVDP